jgi:hypothetical protein
MIGSGGDHVAQRAFQRAVGNMIVGIARISMA